MKIIHFADLHIGVENYGRVDPDTGMNTRTVDALAALDYLVDYAIGESVDAVIFSGDAFKTREPTPTQLNLFAQRVRRLSEESVEVLLLPGNHDLPFAAGKHHALQMFKTLPLDGVNMIDSLGITWIGELQVLTIPWVNRSWLLTDSKYTHASPAALTLAMNDALTALIEDTSQYLAPNYPAIVAGHLSITDAIPGSERRMTLAGGSEPVFRTSVFDDPRFGYVALGHIHRMQVHGSRSHIAYSGSLQRIDFGEEDQEKGFMVVEWSRSAPTMREQQFVPVPSRKFKTFEVDATEFKEVTPALGLINPAEGKDAVVRVKLRVKQGQTVPDGEIRAMFEDCHYWAGLQVETLRPERPVYTGVQVEDWDPLAMLDRYLASGRAHADPERAAAMRTLAEGLVKEE